MTVGRRVADRDGRVVGRKARAGAEPLTAVSPAGIRAWRVRAPSPRLRWVPARSLLRAVRARQVAGPVVLA
ncbi:MAG: hypothetical protein ABW046_07245 [Actinoplanes sp.]